MRSTVASGLRGTSVRRHGVTLAGLALTLVWAAPGPVANEGEQGPATIFGAEVSAPVTPFVFDGDVRDLPSPRPWQPGDPIKEIPRRFYPLPGTHQPAAQVEPRIDPLYERQRDADAVQGTGGDFTTPSRNFAGQGYTGVNPPDTVGDVGPAHYVQMINGGGGALVKIWDKAEPVPGELASFSLDSLGAGACGSGFGDPIVLYDRLADRWMLSEFSGSGNHLCVYVSQTGNPVSGGWFAYDFATPNFPDYPKYGVWPTDANGGQGSYVVTTNESGGPAVYALNRGAMLGGAASTFQRVTLPQLPGFGFEAATPADLDGPNGPPPASPSIVMRHRDTENHSGPAAPGDLLEYWHFDVDWVTPANTVLAAQPSIDVSEFDSDLCGLTSFFCFPQPSGPTLDPLREVIMFPLQYLNVGDHETLVGNLVTDVDGTNHGGLRWFELRRSGGGAWTLHQEGTYSIDADHRWMAASAMDQSGNIAVAYNVSSTSTFPSLRYTGRLSDDPLGLMTQPETVIHAGTASNSSNRYGDYSAIGLDPEDDCTFWFTGEDNLASTWRTQIASFRFTACGCELLPDPPIASATVGGDNRIDVAWNDSSLPSVTAYEIRRSFSAIGPFALVATVADSSPGQAGGPDYVYEDTDVSGGSAYYYVVRSTDGGACRAESALPASAVATGQCTLPPSFDGVVSADTPFSGICTLNVAWDAGLDSCGGPLSYNVYRSTSPGFAPGLDNLLVSGVGGTALADFDSLVSGTPYYYVVRAVDLATGIEETNDVEVAGVPLGELTTGTWIDDAGDTGPAKMLASSPWSLNATEGYTEPKVYKTGTYGDLQCRALTTPELRLGTGSQLGFASRYAIEDSWDKGEVQISVDGGLTWTRVNVAYPGVSTNASDNCGLPTGTYFTGTDANWALYGADLSAWANQFVRLRFVLSSDGSLTEEGWWIDDISITNVDVPGPCATGSNCPDNPLVNVEPGGPFTLCTGEAQPLTASTNGGLGPFSYQWTRDGLPIPGATSTTYVAADATSHVYNCEVRAAGCEDEVKDPASVSISRVSAPFFDGIDSAANSGETTCAIDLSWGDATTLCPGPVLYSVYRDTTSPVAPTLGNRIASGLTDTGFSDPFDLADGATYHYLVRALDASTGVEETNATEAAAVPTGPAGPTQTLFNEDFESATAWATWTVGTGPGPHTGCEWTRVNLSNQRPAAASGRYALTDSDRCGSGSQTSTTLDSPMIDTSDPSFSAVRLEYDYYYRHKNGDDATVQVWDGSAWRIVWSDTNTTQNTSISIDVSAHALGNPSFRVRFNYQNAAFDYWFAVDNVRIEVDTLETCATVDGVPGVPDGSPGTTPLLAARQTPAGDVVDVSWDVSACTAADYHILFGDLAGVAGYALEGSRCSIGTSGAHTWTGVPPGDLYFVIVGTDGAGRESSWGLDGNQVERNGALASGECGSTVKDGSGQCP